MAAMLAAAAGAASPSPEMLGAPKTEIVDVLRRRKHRPPKQTSRSGKGLFLSWKGMEARGWTRNGRGDLLNPKREERRKLNAAFMEHTGRRLSGRQYKRLRRAH